MKKVYTFIIAGLFSLAVFGSVGCSQGKPQDTVVPPQVNSNYFIN